MFTLQWQHNTTYNLHQLCFDFSVRGRRYVNMGNRKISKIPTTHIMSSVIGVVNLNLINFNLSQSLSPGVNVIDVKSTRHRSTPITDGVTCYVWYFVKKVMSFNIYHD